jgi:23S rRNA (guanosine2251-2'-O)-methyltransferase
MMSGETEWIFGRIPVYEVLRAQKRKIKRICIGKNIKEKGVLESILLLARKSKIPVIRVAQSELDEVHASHQGIIASAEGYPYDSLNDILAFAETQEEEPCLLILDALKDPQNLGAILRTAEAVGVHGVILPLRRSASITPAVVKASAGASEHLRVARANLSQTIDLVKQRDIWIMGLENHPDAIPIENADLKRGLALVIGSEQKGMRSLVRKSCDYLIRIPMRGKVESLNASVAAAVALYTIWEKRGYSPSSD